MKVVIDGDSVSENRDHNWPSLLKKRMEVTNLSQHQSTTDNILRRIDYAISQNPDWYLLCIGQWSCKNESRKTFAEGMENIVEILLLQKIKTCLITPPPFLPETCGIAIHIKRIAATRNIKVVDFYNECKEPTWFYDEEPRCHFNTTGAEYAYHLFDWLT